MGSRGGNRKLKLYPTNLTYPTPMLLRKGLRLMPSVGCVECVGLFGGFWYSLILEKSPCPGATES